MERIRLIFYLTFISCAFSLSAGTNSLDVYGVTHKNISRDSMLVLLSRPPYTDSVTINKDQMVERSKANIMRTVMTNLQNLRYAYNRRLKQVPGIFGKITIKFSVDKYGDVSSCDLVKSTVKDEKLTNTILNKVSSWKFANIEIVETPTEVTYPFVFSQGQSKYKIKARDIEDHIVGTRKSIQIVYKIEQIINKIQNIMCKSIAKDSTYTPLEIKLKMIVNHKGRIEELNKIEVESFNEDLYKMLSEKLFKIKFRRDWKNKEISSFVYDFNFTPNKCK